MTSPLLDAAPPGARPRRAVRPFRASVVPAAVGLVAAVAVTVALWAALRRFDGTLGITGAGLAATRVGEVAIALAALAVPAYAVGAVAATRRARRHLAAGDVPAARIAMEDVRARLWVVAGLGVMAAIVAFLARFLSANDGRVRDVLFDWSKMWVGPSALARGFWLNVRLFLAAQAIVLVWALFVAIVRQLPGRSFGPARTLAIAYTDVFRGIPSIIVIYLVVLGFALAEVPPFASWDPDAQRFWLAVLALVLVYGAYVAEVYRAGLDSVHPSQTAAARSLGLSQWQTLRHVVVPQAVRRVLPPLLNDFVALQKDTALVSVVGLLDILNVANLQKNKYFDLSPVTGAALFFLVITIPFTRLVDHLIHRDQQRTRAG